MAFENEEQEEGPLGALGILLQGGDNTTTEEARIEARRIIGRNIGEKDPFADEEKRLVDTLDSSAEAARIALREARAKIMARKQRLAIPLLAASAALSKPTRTGAFSESIGNLSEGLIPVLQNRDQIEGDKIKDLLGIDTNLADIDKGLAASKLELLKLKRQQAGPLTKEALKILGRRTTSNKPLKPLSLFGKQASDEGLQLGTPAYEARVRELQDEDQANKRATSGRDAEEETPEDKIEIANQYGLPVLTIDPFSKLSTKGGIKAREIEQRATDKRLTELEKKEVGNEDLLDEAKEYLQLNKKTTNGPIVGAFPGLTAANQRADSISAKIVPLMRQPGSGSSSDLDIKMFKKAVFGREYNAETNERILKAFIGQRQRAQEKIEFFRNYGQVYNTLRGADSAWKEYLNANPIFDPDPKKQENFVLNPNRKTSSDYFRAKNVKGFEKGGKVKGLTSAVARKVKPLSRAQLLGQNITEYPNGNIAGTMRFKNEKGQEESLGAIDLRRLIPMARSMADQGMSEADVIALPGVQGIRKLALIRFFREAMGENPSGVDAEFAEGGKVKGLKTAAKLRVNPNWLSWNTNTSKMEPKISVVRSRGGKETEVEIPTPIRNRIESEVQKLIDNNVSMEEMLKLVGGRDKRWSPFYQRTYRLFSGEGEIDEELGYAEGGEVDVPTSEDRKIPVRLLRSTLQGASGETADELQALLAKIQGGSYDKELKAERTAQLLSEQEFPLTTNAAEGVGAAGMLALGQAVAARLGMSGQMISQIPQAKLLKLALIGATAGGISGAGAGEGDRGASALQTALLGTAGGTLGGLLAKYGLLGLEEGNDRLRGRAISPATKRLASAFEKDERKPTDLASDVRKRTALGVPTEAGDILGPEGKGLREAASLRAGRPGDEAAEDMAKRLVGSRERVTDQVKKGLKSDEFFGKFDDLVTQLRTNAKPLYDDAYNKYPGINSPLLRELLNTPAGKKAASEAFIKMQNAREPIGAVDATGMVRKPSLKFFDYIKRALDDQVSGLQKTEPDSAKIVRDLRNSLRDELDKLAPEYKTARAQYAGDLEMRDALTAGREDFKNLKPEEVKRKIAGMSFSEKDVFRSGVAQYLSQIINEPSSDINAARKLIGSPDTTAKLQTIFENPREYKVFKAALDAEADMFQRDRKTVNARDRANARRSGTAGDSVFEKLDPSLQEISNTSPMRYVINLLRKKTSMSEATADEIIKTLRTKDPAELKALGERLEGSRKRLARRRGRAGKAGILGAAAAGAMAAPGPKYENSPEDDSEEE